MHATCRFISHNAWPFVRRDDVAAHHGCDDLGQQAAHAAHVAVDLNLLLQLNAVHDVTQDAEQPC